MNKFVYDSTKSSHAPFLKDLLLELNIMYFTNSKPANSEGFLFVA